MQVYIETDEKPVAGVEVATNGTVADLRNVVERTLGWNYFNLLFGTELLRDTSALLADIGI
eukprot:gene39040-6154_t